MGTSGKRGGCVCVCVVRVVGVRRRRDGEWGPVRKGYTTPQKHNTLFKHDLRGLLLFNPVPWLQRRGKLSGSAAVPEGLSHFR